MINQPQHTYIHHHHPHTMNPSHRKNKWKSVSPNRRVQHEIASHDPRCDNSGPNSKIKYRCNSPGSNDNGHFREGRFRCIHSIRKRWHRQSHDSCLPGDMKDKATVEDGWGVGKRKTLQVPQVTERWWNSESVIHCPYWQNYSGAGL